MQRRQPAISLRGLKSASASGQTWGSSRLLMLINAFVGGMVGIERTVVPLIGVGGIRHRVDDAHRLLHRQLRRRQGIRQSRLRPSRRLLGAESACSSSAGSSAFRSLHDHVGAELGLDHRRQCAARHQPGVRLVDDGDHEGRSCRAEIARPRRRPQRVRRLSRGRRDGLPHRLPRLAVRAAPRADLSRHRLCGPGTVLSILLVRDTRDHVRAGDLGNQQQAAPHQLPGGLRAHDLPRPQPVRRLTGGPRQQSQRRHELGNLPAVLRRPSASASSASASSRRSIRPPGAFFRSPPAR